MLSFILGTLTYRDDDDDDGGGDDDDDETVCGLSH